MGEAHAATTLVLSRPLSCDHASTITTIRRAHRRPRARHSRRATHASPPRPSPTTARADAALSKAITGDHNRATPLMHCCHPGHIASAPPERAEPRPRPTRTPFLAPPVGLIPLVNNGHNRRSNPLSPLPPHPSGPLPNSPLSPQRRHPVALLRFARRGRACPGLESGLSTGVIPAPLARLRARGRSLPRT